MASKGWIKLYRDITEHWVYSDPVLLKIWIDILFMANHEAKMIPINNQLIEIKRGSFWTSVRKLSNRWNISKDTTKKKLALFQSDGMIYVDSQPGIGTLITVRNYGAYQDFSDGSPDTDKDRNKDRYKDRVRTKTRTEISHKQEYKNDKALLKNGKNNGLPPDDPDYFEEV